MAQLPLSRSQGQALAALLATAPANPELRAVRHALAGLSWPTRSCLACGVEFDAGNDRRTTCSARCRQALHRRRQTSGRAVPGTPQAVSPQR